MSLKIGLVIVGALGAAAWMGPRILGLSKSAEAVASLMPSAQGSDFATESPGPRAEPALRTVDANPARSAEISPANSSNPTCPSSAVASNSLCHSKKPWLSGVPADDATARLRAVDQEIHARLDVLYEAQFGAGSYTEIVAAPEAAIELPTLDENGDDLAIRTRTSSLPDGRVQTRYVTVQPRSDPVLAALYEEKETLIGQRNQAQ